MVKKIDLQTFIPTCTAQTFFDTIYGNAATMHQYHQLVNSDPAAEVTPWENGVRTVSFQMPLKIPDFLKKAFGVESVKIQEKQTVVWHNSGDFSVTSETVVMNVPGANRFTTSLYLTASEEGQHSATAAAVAAATAAVAASSPDASPQAMSTSSTPFDQQVADATAAGVAAATGIEIKFTVRCGAGLPWPMNQSVENIMAEKAQISMTGFLDFCCQMIEEAQSALSTTPSLKTLPSISGPSQSKQLSTRPSMRRWPAAIASSSAYEPSDLELPLLEVRSESSEFQDAREAFATPGSRSGSTSPGIGKQRGASMSATEFQSLLDGIGASNGAQGANDPAFKAALNSQLQNLASASAGWGGGSRSAVPELHQVVVVLQSLSQAVQSLDAKVTTLMKDAVPGGTGRVSRVSDLSRHRTGSALPPTPVLSAAVLRAGIALLVVIMGVGVGYLVLHYWHRTGLLPSPPLDDLTMSASNALILK